jgi:phosphoglycolate phosphatase-like HAD superfamily hydrolase
VIIYNHQKKGEQKMKTLVFDMDGTIADLYGVKGWLKMLRAEDPTPYEKARPMYDMVILTAILWVLKNDGWRIAVTSWLAKDSSPEYDAKVRQAKRNWLNRYDFPYDEIHLVKYGTTKADCTRKHGGIQILVDDNEKVRNGWHLGDTINANENIIPILSSLIA